MIQVESIAPMMDYRMGNVGTCPGPMGGPLIYIYISIFYFFIILSFNGQDFGHEGTLMFLIYKMNTSHLKKKMTWRQCRSAWSTVNFRGKMEKRVLSRSAKRKRKNEKDTKDTALVGLQQIPSITTFFNKKREQEQKTRKMWNQLAYRRPSSRCYSAGC